MIALIILAITFILSLIGLIVFNKISSSVSYDLRLFKLGIFLYFISLIFDFIKELSVKFPSLTTSLESIQLSPEYLVLASKLVLIPLFAIVLLVGIIKLNQEIQEDAFRVQMEKL